VEGSCVFVFVFVFVSLCVGVREVLVLVGVGLVMVMMTIMMEAMVRRKVLMPLGGKTKVDIAGAATLLSILCLLRPVIGQPSASSQGSLSRRR
jgi:hypothetical protein